MSAIMHMLVGKDAEHNFDERASRSSDMEEALAPCDFIAVRVAMRFQYGKDYDFIDEQTCSLSLHEFFFQVKEQDESPKEDLLCGVNAGNGFYRMMELNDTLAMAMAVHKEASLEERVMQLEFFTVTDLINCLGHAGKVHLPVLSRKRNKYFWFAEKESGCEHFMELCKMSHHDLHFDEVMVCRGNTVLMTQSQMFKFNAAQMRHKLRSSDWICEASLREPFNLLATDVSLPCIVVIVKEEEGKHLFAPAKSVAAGHLKNLNQIHRSDDVAFSQQFVHHLSPEKRPSKRRCISDVIGSDRTVQNQQATVLNLQKSLSLCRDSPKLCCKQREGQLLPRDIT